MLTEYRLAEAILVYSADGTYERKLYLQRHGVAEKEGRPVLLEGVPYTQEDLTALCRELLPGLVTERLAFMEAGVLATSGSSIGPDVWWVPGCVRPVFFENLDVKSGKAPWPSLIFVAYKKSLEVYAIKGLKRPGLKTRLYVAPFPNMRGSQVCLGNSPVPDKCFEHEKWERAFFDSGFSEIHEARRVKTGSLTGFWDGLVKSGAKRFPDEEFIPCQSFKTVSDLLSDLRRKMEHGY